MATFVFAGSGVWQIALGIYFALLRPALLPEDGRYIGASVAHIEAALPGINQWLRHVFMVMGGFMVASGLFTMFVGLTMVAERRNKTGIVLLIAGLASVATMSWMNFVMGSNFKWLLLGPVLLWFAGLARYASEGRHTREQRPSESGHQVRIVHRLRRGAWRQRAHTRRSRAPVGEL